jgi:oxygen-independent coproporphyrinogen-3 oxidase
MDSKNPGLYIHIPFCLMKCPYCNFYSQTKLSLIPDFIEALGKEMEMVSPGFSSPFDTVYIGGGTPSVLGPEHLKRILAGIRKHFPLACDTEITMEANPADLDFSFAELLRSIGVNRLSLGIQSFDPKVIHFLSRRHTVSQAISAIDASRQAGFDQVGLDLIYGVPGQTIKSWLATLHQAIAFSPEHISCYQLTIEADTPMGAAYHRGNFILPGEEELLEFFMTTAQKIEEAGFIQYEVSNFARRSRYTSRHNQKYWSHTPYLGLGPSAHSFMSQERWWNFRSVDTYIGLIREGKPPIQGKEFLSLEQQRLEALFLGLRTTKGINMKDFREKFKCDLMSEKREILTRLQDGGLLVISEGSIYPTRAGLALADRLAMI